MICEIKGPFWYVLTDLIAKCEAADNLSKLLKEIDGVLECVEFQNEEDRISTVELVKKLRMLKLQSRK